ncbi:synaptotagmin-like protein 1 isoform X2 [Tachyglossus aculeatus]|uniref:synaptotagmin-like protein 1 isoform X2 n=1 Tax=Tachyglossus aculeatus TaxID=9261 RepID=UPI0018F7421B|nr:synaptotagmin-like protein 1 isoform X2 [Tachyglossus aculeatus]
MAEDPGAEVLLDLSFLTEEEHEAIAAVLTRDARLRLLEEGRVSKLRATLSDPERLKTLTGDWFHDARSKRHRHAHLGSDLVRASIRRKKKAKSDGEHRGGRSEHLEDVGEGESAPSEPDARYPGEADLREQPLTEDPDTEPDDEPRSPAAAAAASPWPVGVERAGPPPQPEPEPDPEPEFVADPEEAAPDPRRADPVRDPEPQAAAEASPQSEQALENGQEETPGDPEGGGGDPGSPLSKMLSSSSSVSSLSSSTLSGSLLSLYSEAELSSGPVRGAIQVSLLYEQARRELQVTVIQCRGLAEAKKRRSDPYVKSYLLPDKSGRSKRKTAVKKRNLNPVYNETLKYPMERSELPGRVLSLSVWHHDSLARNLFLGEAEIPLDTWDWDSAEPAWLNLQARSPGGPDALPTRGQLSLALKFIPAGYEGAGLPPSGELHFWVKDAQNLIPLRSGPLDCYVQCFVLPDASRASRQKTRVVKRSLSPVFNHTMVYDGFRADDLRQACAELTLWDRDTFTNRRLGGTRLSLGTGSSYGLQVTWMDSTPEEQQLWQRLLAQPGEWVEGILPLRTNLTSRA